MPNPSDDTIDLAAFQLGELRVEIDRIDAAMHGLLIDRSAIIDQLIAIKARQGGGSAFRPGREAEMMRRIAERHCGRLPLDTVESIWRVIISTFTYVQASYAVHADMAGGDTAMRDSARFHFGFTVPLHAHFGVDGVIQAVAQAQGDLGLLRVEGHTSKGAWWRFLASPDAPKIIARLPFIERPDHPAGMPVFVIARPFAAAAARDVLLHAVTLDEWRDTIPEVMATLGGEIVGHTAHGAHIALLVATSGSLPIETLRDALNRAAGPVDVTEVGSHAARFELG